MSYTEKKSSEGHQSPPLLLLLLLAAGSQLKIVKSTSISSFGGHHPPPLLLLAGSRTQRKRRHTPKKATLENKKTDQRGWEFFIYEYNKMDVSSKNIFNLVFVYPPPLSGFVGSQKQSGASFLFFSCTLAELFRGGLV